ncbi:hypothetical protein AB6A23_07775 [Paenibacillus tarimensis]
MEHSNSDTIRIFHEGVAVGTISPQEMAELAGGTFDISERVPNAEGKAFDFHSWYKAWRHQNGLDEDISVPNQLTVEAADTFEAVIPWSQLENAAVLYASPDGGALTKSGPIRLYAPNGTSDCLNVKSIVLMRFMHDGSHNREAHYGFKNVFTPDELRKK